MSDIISKVLSEVLDITYTYFETKYEGDDIEKIENDLLSLAGVKSYSFDTIKEMQCSYENIQNVLSTLNENEENRKNKGVYYTPEDVVRFIIKNSIKSVYDKLSVKNIRDMDLDEIPCQSFCTTKRVFDPTCGAGEFLLATLDIKFDLLDANISDVTEKEIEKILSTVFGNDTNSESTAISKIRLYLCTVKRYGIYKCDKIHEILNENFTNKDFISKAPEFKNQFDLIIGNPPYIEDGKCQLTLSKTYGNVYANVLMNATKILNNNGTIGFVIPLSYVSTPRMQSIRQDLFSLAPEQFIFSYSDRPDCLFKSVHQKLCILIAKKRNGAKRVFTGNYQYWYKEEREYLFTRTAVIQNNFFTDKYIPKLGNSFDTKIYKKIQDMGNHQNLINLQTGGESSVYLNMRATFWIKAFRGVHNGSEYKQFRFENESNANYFFCLVNSSLFWWYWICVSDCWHITNKELRGFNIPTLVDFGAIERLATKLEKKLEETKLYVGTKQTDYEYKHKLCVDEVHEIDDYVNHLYGLTEAENMYIKNFAYRYRISGGTK